MTLNEIVTYLVTDDGIRHDEPVADHELRQRYGTRLHHQDLPRLDAAELLEYDPEQKVVEPTRTLTAAGPLLDEMDGDDGSEGVTPSWTP